MPYSAKNKMNIARKIFSNFLSLTASEIVSKLLQLLVFVYLARELGKESFGVFSFGIAFALLVFIIADFGLSTLLIREISRNKKAASKYITNAFVIKIFLTIITLVVAFLFLNLLNYSQEVKLIAYTMLSFTILQSFTDLYYSIFRAFERMHYDASIKILRMLILVTAIFFVIKNNFSLATASLAFPITEIITLTITVILVYTKFIKISFDFDYRFSKEIVKKSSFFCLSMVFAGLFMYTDQIMLSKLGSVADVGIYAAASNIMLALIFIPMMYANAIYPVISKFFISSKKSLKLAYERSFKYMLILGLAVSTGIFSLSENIVSLLYGPEYKETAIVLAILSGYLFLRFINVISGFTLSSINRQDSRIFSQGTAALTNIILNFILIPMYGFIGAAVATLITEIIFFSTYLSFIFKYDLRIKFVKLCVKPVIAAIVMTAALFFIENLFLEMLVGAIVYIGVLLVLKTIDKEDRLIINKIMKN
jgi:O-antigen/teichoic acid export membrane protein